MLPDHKRFNLGYVSARAAEAVPDAVAVVDLHGGGENRITYRQLERRLNRFAAALQGLGVPAGERVALLLGNRIEFIEAMYGSMRAGCVPVMVNTKLGQDGMEQSIREAGASVAIVERDCNPSAMPATVNAGCTHRILLDEANDGWLNYAAAMATVPDAVADRFEPPPLPSDSVSELCFTSGSSGRPKAVMNTHRNILMKLHVYAPLTQSIVGGTLRTLVSLPIFHANGRLSIGSAFETGGLVVIQPKFDARQALRNLSHYRITYLLAVAPAYAAMLKEQDLIDSLDFSSLTHLYVGSATSGGDVMPRIARALGVRIIHTYGSTEAGVVLQMRPDEDCPLASCGRPPPGVEVKIIDVDSGRESNFGELWVRGESLAAGYWQRPEITAEKFVNGWYRSGDLFERDVRGLHYFRGRTDEMFNVGGEKVYPTEVENILQRHPAVLSACVVAVTHASKGEAPAAMVIAVKDATLSEDELKQFFLLHGPGYAHPRKVVFAHEFPVAATGKIDRARVKALLQAAYLG